MLTAWFQLLLNEAKQTKIFWKLWFYFGIRAAVRRMEKDERANRR